MCNEARSYISLRHADATELHGVLVALRSEDFLQAVCPCPEPLLAESEPEDGQATPTSQQIKNLMTFGHASWYSWAKMHWGTKWATVRTVVEGDGFIWATIDFAWTAPRPIFDLLVRRGFTVDVLTVCESLEWFEKYSGSGDPDGRLTTYDFMTGDKESRHRKITYKRTREDIRHLHIDALLASPLCSAAVDALSVRSELEQRVKDRYEGDA